MASGIFPPRGEFPFPLRRKQRRENESAYLIWLRNHSSYLTVGDLISKLGSITCFVLGTIGNSLILFPWMVLIAFLIGGFHFQLVEHRLASFLVIAELTMFVVVISFVYRRFISGSLADSSRYILTNVRWAGLIFLSALIASVVLAVPWIVESMRDQLRHTEFSWFGLASALTGVSTAFGTIKSFIPIKQGMWRTVYLTGLALFGFACVVVVVICLENFVVYGNALRLVPQWLPIHLWSEPFIYLWIFLSAVIVVAIRVGVAGWKLSFRVVYFPVLATAVFCCVGLSLHFFDRPLIDLRVEEELEHDAGAFSEMRNGIGRLTLPLSGIANVEVDDRIDTGLKKILLAMKNQKRQLDEFYSLQPHDYADLSPLDQHRDPWSVRYYELAMDFADNGAEISESGRQNIERLRHLFARPVRWILVQEATHPFAPEKKKSNKDDQKDEARQVPEAVAVSCVGALIQNFVARAVQSQVAQDRKNSAKATARLTWERVTSELYAIELLNRLQSEPTNARDQHEFAVYTRRIEELAGVDSSKSETIGTPGILALLPKWIVGEDEPRSHQIAIAVETATEIFLTTRTDDEFNQILSSPIAQTDKFKSLIADEKISRALRTLPVLSLRGIVSSYRDRPYDAKAKAIPAKNRSPIIKNQIASWQAFDARLKDLFQPKPNYSTHNVARIARWLLIGAALTKTGHQRDEVLAAIGHLCVPEILGSEPKEVQEAYYRVKANRVFDPNQILRAVMASFSMGLNNPQGLTAADDLVLVMQNGPKGAFQNLNEIRQRILRNGLPVKYRILGFLALLSVLICYLFCDVNKNSLHGFYRDQLAGACFLKKVTLEGSDLVAPNRDVRITDLSQPGSIGPYLIMNAAMNLQASQDLTLRDRRSDFFMFSKYFSGSERTNYVATGELEKVFRHLRLSTAIAISAAAASPNMGRNTNGIVVFIMTILNIRLGYWVPNPRSFPRDTRVFRDVFLTEMREQVRHRRINVAGQIEDYSPEQQIKNLSSPTIENDLVGFASSGGGIRSAAVNLGIAQSLHEHGVFHHIDFHSTVSGGGYTGASIAVLMNSLNDVAPMVRTSHPQRQLPLGNFVKEMVSSLDEQGDWLNLSDGGHIENLGVIELLRRRCRFILVGDAEEDASYRFNGVGTLARLAKLELGVEINIDLDEVRPGENGLSQSHFAIGEILYPRTDDVEAQSGVLLYLKSSMVGDESERINEYKSRKADFPHETTADQFFERGQFDAYRELGVKMADSAMHSLADAGGISKNELIRFSLFARSMNRALENLERKKFPPAWPY